MIYTYKLVLFLLYCDTRTDANGEVANQQVYLPGILPKVPGRFYFYFGKPIETEGTPNAYFIISQLGIAVKCGGKI
jgi:hypothetical protein